MTSVIKNQMAHEDSRHAFVMHNEVRAIQNFQGQTILAIRAPSGTTLEVPDPDEGLHGTGRRRFQIFLKSHNDPVSVFLVSSNTPMTTAGDTMEINPNRVNNEGSANGLGKSKKSDSTAA